MLKFIKLLIIIFLCSHLAQAQFWTLTNGPRGLSGDLWSGTLVECNSKLYVGNNGCGVYSSSDDGKTWTYMVSSPSYVICLQACGPYVFAGTQNSGIYRYDPSTNTWSQVLWFPGRPVTCLVAEHDSLFALIDLNGLFVSTDFGLHWTDLNSSLPDLFLHKIAFKDGILYGGGSSGHFYYTSDLGLSWTTVNINSSCIVFSISVVDTNVFAGSTEGVYRLNKDKNKWTEKNNGLNPIPTVYDLKVQGTRLFATTYSQGLYTSDNNGDLWQACNTGLGGATGSYLGIIEGKLFASTNSTLYSSVNNGLSWSPVLDYFPYLHVLSLSVVDSGIFTTLLNHGVYFSSDMGEHWCPRSFNSGFHSFDYKIVKKDSVLFLPTDGGIFSSRNSGITWYPNNTGIPYCEVYTISVCGNHVFAGTKGKGIFRLNDDGNAWTAKNQGLAGNIVYFVYSKSNSVYIATNYGVYFSDNFGENWTKRSEGLPGWVLSITSMDSLLFAGTRDDGVFISSDGGNYWHKLNSGLPGNNVTSLLSWDTLVFAAIKGYGVFRLIKSSLKWENFNTGLTNFNVFSLALTKDTLFAGTDKGIWKSPLCYLPPDPNAPFSIHLFPNPSRNIITAQISGEGKPSQLSVYSVLGQRILDVNVVNNEAVIDISFLSNGLYFIKSDNTDQKNGKWFIKE
ncbi:MAG: T9SS type A sorting domain-containing protein [Bacteroidales bacterium]